MNPPTPLYDAHCHLADSRLAPYSTEIASSLRAINYGSSIVNGTSPADWSAVRCYAKSNPTALAAIGLHPWQVNSAPRDWQSGFLEALDHGVRIVGEIGLDQWISDHDIEAQQIAFKWQLAEAAKRNFPVSIHCLKAIDPLMKTLRVVEQPQRGIHLHALNISVEAARQLIEMDAYFSFNSGQLKPNVKHIYDLIRAIPDDRILIETDAPDFLPRPEHRAYALPEIGLNHPANLVASYQSIAAVRQQTFEELSYVVAANFNRYFINES